MALTKADVVELVSDQLMPTYLRERERLDRIDRWHRWQHEDMDLPRRSGREIKQLVQLAKTPWLSLVVTAVVQVMYVDGYRSPPGARWRRRGRSGCVTACLLARCRCIGLR